MKEAIASGADVDALDVRRSRNGRRALNWAAINDHAPVIEVLLHAGADVEGANLTGFTALHHAAEDGSLRAARVLVEAGADARTVNRDGVSALATARRFEHVDVVALLEEAMAMSPSPAAVP